jgi:hypothetical protein
LLLLARSYMSISEDPTTGKNQRASAFWTRIHILYNKNVHKANSKRESDPDRKILLDNRPKGLLKSQWYTWLQPAIQKFAVIVDKNPPASGYNHDDPEMNLYWKLMRNLYSEQATEGLPKNFSPYMRAHFFLCGHPKFALVIESNKKSVIRRKGCKPKVVSDNVTMSAQETPWKQSSSTMIVPRKQGDRFHCWQGCWGHCLGDCTRNYKSWNFDFDETVEDGLAKANEIMQTMSNHQAMSIARPEIKDRYFSEVFDLINEQSRNKKLCLQLEN